MDHKYSILFKNTEREKHIIRLDELNIELGANTKPEVYEKFKRKLDGIILECQLLKLKIGGIE
jgi:hypothetical protein